MKQTTCIMACSIVLLAQGALRGEPVEPYPLFDWPAEQLPWVSRSREYTVFESRLLDLWLDALKQPDVTTRRSAADAIGRAFREGMTQAASRAGEPLITALQEATNIALRDTIAQTLVTLDYQPAGDELLALSRHERSYMVIRLDPALARWDQEGARELWLSRLNDEGVSRSIRRSAIESLGTVGEPRAIEPVVALCRDDDAPATLRLAAADALAQLDSERAIVTGEALVSDPSASLLHRMIASRLAAASDSEQTRKLLLTLAVDDEPAVAAAAARRLLQLDAMLLAGHADRLMASPDARLRQVAMVVYDTMATPDAIESLAWMLNDPNPSLRAETRLRLHGSDANSNLTTAVRDAVMARLASNASDAIVESAVLLGRLDHQPAAPRLVELLGDPRHDVRMAAIVGLRWLANEQTYPKLYEHAMMLSRALVVDRRRAYVAGFDAELQQILQTFGTVKFAPADTIMRQYVPRRGSNFSPGVRSSAIWALGQLHEDHPDEALGDAFVRRLRDVRARWSERHEVRLMAAIALGRMRASEHEHVLREYAASGNADPSIMMACRWAIERTTGEPIQPMTPIVHTRAGWFLEPIDP